jgi:hypothetical protein
VYRGETDPFAGIKEASEAYKVYDSHYEKIGKVDDLITDEDDRVAYIGVKMGFFGTNSTLIPTEIIRINDKRRLTEVSEPAETIEHAPHFGRSEELTPELENHVRTYFGLESLRPSSDHAPQGPDILEAPSTQLGPDQQAGTKPGDRASPEERSVPAPGSAPQEERPAERRPERASEQEPISERLSEESEGLMGRLRTGSGVTVHRLKGKRR